MSSDNKARDHASRVVVRISNASNKDTFLSELRKLDIAEDVATEANRIWQELPPECKKNKKRSFRQFFCIYNACKNIGRPQVPKTVANIVGLPYNKISKAVKKFPIINGPTHTSFVDFIPTYCEKIGIDDNTVVSIQDLGRSILVKCRELDDEFPQNIAVGMIVYYLAISGVEIDRKAFSKKVQLSEVTISTIHKKIVNIDNGARS